MRDEILKGVARPKEVRLWVDRTFRAADRLSGRSLDSLLIVLDKFCKSELSSQFRTEVLRRIDSPQLPLTPCEIDGSSLRGGPLEESVLCFMKVIWMDRSLDMRAVVVRAVAGALNERIKATIRQVEVNAIGQGDEEALEGLNQMRKDSETIDMHAIARAWLTDDGSSESRRRVQGFCLDEDLLGQHDTDAGARR